MNTCKVIYLNTAWKGCQPAMLADEKRSCERFDCEAPVIIENCETGELYDGTLYNYSLSGMYLECDYPLPPGSEVHIVVEQEESATRPTSCRVRVVWCEEIPGAIVLYNYGIGVCYVSRSDQMKVCEKFKIIQGGLADIPGD